MRNESFTCEKCREEVSPHPTGSARNHCPKCLYSKHVDHTLPGDRLSDCHGLMRPIGVNYKKNKGDMIVHECEKCHKKILNQVAPDDAFLQFVREMNKKFEIS